MIIVYRLHEVYCPTMFFFVKDNGFGWIQQISRLFVFLKIFFLSHFTLDSFIFISVFSVHSPMHVPQLFAPI